ncbi:MAG: 2-phospho-L-lactate guanylyltransferase [Solirubrobacteraceae bacterium]|nr:2-phospho-L-lactate guanylyltransferase [Solirubrobacteraceae bacterium]
MTTLAILPVKGFGRAKQRLRERVPDGPRAGLAEAMVRDVLRALGETAGIDGVIVVTAEPVAAALAREAGADVVHDPAESGQSDAVALGVRRALERGAGRVVAVPGDCPALDPAELEALLASEEAVVIVPDRHGTGTNALLLAPPDAIAPSFGPGSRDRHEAAARASGLPWAVRAVATLGMDADTPDDLATLEASGRLGPRTLQALDRLAAR